MLYALITFGRIRSRLNIFVDSSGRPNSAQHAAPIRNRPNHDAFKINEDFSA